jgi:hypothetical protein
MRIFKSKQFHKWAANNQLSDIALIKATKEIEAGLIDADLGGNVYKKRIATKGRGKSGSVRTLLAYSEKRCTYYIFAFEKSDKDNITPKEKEAIKIVAELFLKLSDEQIDEKKQQQLLFEIMEE